MTASLSGGADRCMAFLGPVRGVGESLRTSSILKALADAGVNVVTPDTSLLTAPRRLHVGIGRFQTLLRGIPGMRRTSLCDRRRLELLRSYCHALKLGRRVAEQYPHANVIHAQTHSWAVPAWAASRKLGVPFVYGVHGLVTEERRERGEPESVVALTRRMESVLLRDASYVIVANESLGRHLCANDGVAADRIVVAPHGVGEVEQRAGFTGGNMRAAYAGALSYWERPIDVVKCAKLSQRCDLTFHIIGGGPLRDELLAAMSTCGGNVAFYGKKSRCVTSQMLSTMHIGLAPSTTDVVRVTASPIKVLEYAAHGLPIVTVDVGDWSREVADRGAGIVVAESEPSLFLDAIEELRERDRWHACAEAGVRWAETRPWSETLGPIVRLYRDLLT